MRDKNNRKAGEWDVCLTPDYALDPLYKLIPLDWVILEPAAGPKGQRNIVRCFRARGYKVIEGDLSTGEDFFTHEYKEHWDCIVTNPPWSTSKKYKFIARCYQLGKPWAMIMPIETIGANAAQKHFKKFGMQPIYLDRRVNFFMPKKGYQGTAPFPVCWFSWQLKLIEPVLYASIHYRPDSQISFDEYLFKKQFQQIENSQLQLTGI